MAGAPVRPAVSLTPLLLDDGLPAVAWADDNTVFRDLPVGAGRLHLAFAGAPVPAGPPPPRLTVPRLARERLHADDPLVLSVRCAAACDVRATLVRGGQPVASVGSRARAGTLTLRLYSPGDPIAARGARRVTVALRASAPGARATVARRVHVPVMRRVSQPVPHLLDVVGRGRRVFRVRLRNAASAHRVVVFAFGGGDRRSRSVTVRVT